MGKANDMKALVFLWIVAVACLGLLLPGCSTKTQWYKPNRSQLDFERDAQECEIIAREFARQATLTGEREDPATLAKSFDVCLGSKGWTHMPRQQKNLEVPEVAPMAQYHEGELSGFDLILDIPDDFKLVSDKTQPVGSSISQTFVFVRNGTYINILFQKLLFGSTFDVLEYPVVEPFFLYHRGENAGRRSPLRWALFAGEFKKQWMVGYGAFIRVSKTERVILSVVHPLPNQQERPPTGLRLTEEQFLEAERFREEWVGWLID